MKSIRQYIVLALLLGMLSAHSPGQTLPRVCVGSKVRYGVQGLANSHFDWTVQGATILNNYGDSIDVQWNVPPGIYSLSVLETSEYNCVGQAVSAQVQVSYNTISIGTNLEVCSGDSLLLVAPGGFVSYQWSNGATTRQTFSRGGPVWVIATDASGCQSRDSVFVKVNPLPVIDLGPDTTLCGNETFDLDAGPGWSSYHWIIRSGSKETEESGQTITVGSGAKIVRLEVADTKGCVGRDTVAVLPCSINRILGVIPNAFTPNNDGRNDTWHIEKLANYPDASVEIYDRWGRIVFRRDKGYSNAEWDGTSNGKPLPMDAYFFVIDLHIGIEPITGSVTIIR